MVISRGAGHIRRTTPDRRRFPFGANLFVAEQSCLERERQPTNVRSYWALGEKFMANAIVVVGASSGGIAPLRMITELLPRSCKATLFVVSHVGRVVNSLPEILSWNGRLPVSLGAEGTMIEPGHIYVAPSDRHMLVTADNIELRHSPLIHFTRPAIDPLFMSAAVAFRERVIGVILSGEGQDGADGLVAIKSNGGIALVQEPGEAVAPGMPQAALHADDPERLPIEAIARRISEFCSRT
jgi:two-component system, chemotaxis family, protein-glutamate methylesterase/glutaminase